jgi:dsRNA-specific ribonuclease
MSKVLQPSLFFLQKPSLQSLSALNHRLRFSIPPTSSVTKIDIPLPQLERALISPSFWSAVEKLPLESVLEWTQLYPTTSISHFNDPDDVWKRLEDLHGVEILQRKENIKKKPFGVSGREREGNKELRVLGNEIFGFLGAEEIEHRFRHVGVTTKKHLLTHLFSLQNLVNLSQQFGISPSPTYTSWISKVNIEGEVENEKLQKSKDGDFRIRKLNLTRGRFEDGVGLATEEERSVTFRGLIRYRPTPSQFASSSPNTSSSSPTISSLEDELSGSMKSLLALIYTNAGLETTRLFLRTHIFSLPLDINSFLKWDNPRFILSQTLQKYSRPAPLPRLLKESGRYTLNPTFLIGIYSGAEKLGEGYGSSIRMAKYRAYEDSLRRIYLAPGGRLRDGMEVSRPSDAMVWEENRGKVGGGVGAMIYRPGVIGDSEVLRAGKRID